MQEDILTITNNYVTKLITNTFGFVPQVQTYFDALGYIKVLLDGDEEQRRMMMGRQSNNFQALKTIIKIFCKTHGYDSYLYIAPGKNATNFGKEQDRPNSDW